jgi:hypothetical protein
VLQKVAPGQRTVLTDQSLEATTRLLEDWVGMQLCVQKMGVTVDDGDRVRFHDSIAA